MFLVRSDIFQTAHFTANTGVVYRVTTPHKKYTICNVESQRNYIRLVKDMYHQCKTVVRCAAGTSEPFAMEVGLHQVSAFIQPFLFAIMMDTLTENIKKAPWQVMFADDVVLCARKKDVLELELEQWREALEKRGMKVSRAKTEYACLRPCSHHRFGTGTVPEPFQLPVFRPVPLRPLVPVRADHLAM